VKKNELFILIDLALAVVKDIALEDRLKKIQSAQREYIQAQACANRSKSKAIIKAIVNIDTQVILLERDYLKVKDTLETDGRAAMEPLITMLKKERIRLVNEKNAIMNEKTE